MLFDICFLLFKLCFYQHLLSKTDIPRDCMSNIEKTDRIAWEVRSVMAYPGHCKALPGGFCIDNLQSRLHTVRPYTRTVRPYPTCLYHPGSPRLRDPRFLNHQFLNYLFHCSRNTPREAAGWRLLMGATQRRPLKWARLQPPNSG